MRCLICQKPSQPLHSLGFIKLYHCGPCHYIFAGTNTHFLRTTDWGEELAEFNDYYFHQFRLKDQTSLELLSQYQLLTPAKALDIGCGPGSFLARLRELGWQVTGIEPSPSLCKLAKDRYGIKLINQEFSPKAFNLPLDLITFFDVIEHLPKPSQFLAQVNQVLKPGGHVLIKVPNWSSLTVQLCLASFYLSAGRVLSPIEMVTQAEYNYHHVSYFTPESLTRLLKRHHFKIIHVATETTILRSRFFNRHEFRHLNSALKTAAEASLSLLQFFENLSNRRDTLTLLAQKPGH